MADVKNKWENSSWGRKLIVQKRRAALSDFDRFKLMLAKIKVCNYSNIISWQSCTILHFCDSVVVKNRESFAAFIVLDSVWVRNE